MDRGRFAVTAAAVLMGLGAVACDKGGAGPVEPEYGAPAADTLGEEPGVEPDDVGEPEYGVPAAGVDESLSDAGEAEYGVPATDRDLRDVPEPDYGVPSTDD